MRNRSYVLSSCMYSIRDMYPSIESYDKIGKYVIVIKGGYDEMIHLFNVEDKKRCLYRIIQKDQYDDSYTFFNVKVIDEDDRGNYSILIDDRVYNILPKWKFVWSNFNTPYIALNGTYSSGLVDGYKFRNEVDIDIFYKFNRLRRGLSRSVYGDVIMSSSDYYGNNNLIVKFGDDYYEVDEDCEMKQLTYGYEYMGKVWYKSNESLLEVLPYDKVEIGGISDKYLFVEGYGNVTCIRKKDGEEIEINYCYFSDELNEHNVLLNHHLNVFGDKVFSGAFKTVNYGE